MKVEGYDPRRIMKIKAGMAINIGPDWAVGDGDLTEDEVDALKAD